MHVKIQGTKIAKTFLNKNSVGGLTFPNLKTQDKTIVIKTLFMVLA